MRQNDEGGEEEAETLVFDGVGLLDWTRSM